jgi:AraC-like DNA-binding protein
MLQQDIECIRIAKYSGQDGIAINVAPNALPGIVFQHRNGTSALENIVTPSGIASTPTLFLYGTGTEPSVMNYKNGSYTTIQIVLKPYALKTLFGLNAAELTNGYVELNEFAKDDLNAQLMDSGTTRDGLASLIGFLVAKFRQANTRDRLVEESLCLIHQNIAAISVKFLLEALHISERQFERRFSQSVGVSPQSYIRVKRFNEAIRLLKNGSFTKLTDIAHTLNFYDQSHFIREIKAFSGLTPTRLTRQADSFLHTEVGYSYLER